MVSPDVTEVSREGCHNHNELFRIVTEPIYRTKWIVIDPRGRKIWGPDSMVECAEWRREHEAEIASRPDVGYSVEIGSPEVII